MWRFRIAAGMGMGAHSAAGCQTCLGADTLLGALFPSDLDGVGASPEPRFRLAPPQPARVARAARRIDLSRLTYCDGDYRRFVTYLTKRKTPRRVHSCVVGVQHIAHGRPGGKPRAGGMSRERG